MKRGWFGIALYEPKIEANLGTIMRSVVVFGAAFVALINARYQRMAMDTVDAQKQLPVLYFQDWAHFTESMRHYPLVGVEVGRGVTLQQFRHPEQAVYVFGGEDRTLPVPCSTYTHLETGFCLNLGIVVNLVMYTRQAQP